MKTLLRFISVALMIILFVAGFAAANFSQATVAAKDADASSALQLASPTPVLIDASEIGSTDGILFMGIVIVLIVTLPLLFRKRGK